MYQSETARTVAARVLEYGASVTCAGSQSTPRRAILRRGAPGKGSGPLRGAEEILRVRQGQ